MITHMEQLPPKQVIWLSLQPEKILQRYIRLCPSEKLKWKEIVTVSFWFCCWVFCCQQGFLSNEIQQKKYWTEMCWVANTEKWNTGLIALECRKGYKDISNICGIKFIQSLLSDTEQMFSLTHSYALVLLHGSLWAITEGQRKLELWLVMPAMFLKVVWRF